MISQVQYWMKTSLRITAPKSVRNARSRSVWGKVFGVLRVAFSLLDAEVFEVFEGSRDDHGRRLWSTLSAAGKDLEFFKCRWE